jgi:hypothetical protein
MRGLRRAFCLLVAVCSAACAPVQPGAAFDTLVNRDASPEHRLAALHRLGPLDDWPEPVAAVAALSSIAWSDTQPEALRRAAIDRLIAHDEATFRSDARQRLARVNHWPILEHVFAAAVERRWDDFPATAIRSWARPSRQYGDDDRPERTVIAALVPDRQVEDVVFETFVGMGRGLSEADQVAAWAVLSRLLPPTPSGTNPTLVALLSSVPPATPLVRDLQDAAAVLDVLPRDAEGLRWLAAVRAAEEGRWWPAAAAMIASLTPTQHDGLELRHLPVLLRLSAGVRAMERDALVDRVRQRLAGRWHMPRRESGALPGATSERFEDHVDKLTWADLAAIDLVLDAMEDPNLVAQFFVQADADLLDTRTEYGGVLEHDGSRFIARAFRPDIMLHDRAFYASEAMIRAMYTGVAHYHFHAQQHNNAAFAGPGAGDIDFVERIRPTALVLTFIDRRTLNVDYQQPGGVVIDLGMIFR